MTIPEDPGMLLSFINMKLRDGDYTDLEDLCHSLNIETAEIVKKLKSAGFDYLPEIKQFR